MGKICVECEDPSWTGQPPIKAPELPTDGGGVKLVDELPETGQKGMAYVLVDNLEAPTKSSGIFVYQNGWVQAGADQTVQIVDELPETGEEGIVYWLKKSDEDAYDLYEWRNNAWLKVDTDIQLYNNTGEHTDGAMTQKAVTDALNDKQNVLTAGDSIDITNDIISATNTGKAKVLTANDYNYPTNSPTSVALWLLEPGMYYKTDSSVSVLVDQNSTLGVNGLAIVGGFNSVFGYTPIYSMNCGSTTGIDRFLALFVVRADGTKYFARNINFAVDTLTSNSANSPLSAKQGRVLKNLVDSIAIRKAGAPATSTAGSVGTLYEDTTNGELYICTVVSGSTYTWKKVGLQYKAGEGLNLSASNEFSVDTAVVALKEDLPTVLTDAQYEGLWGQVEEQLTTVVSGTGA